MTLGFEIVSLPCGTIRQLDQKAFEYGPLFHQRNEISLPLTRISNATNPAGFGRVMDFDEADDLRAIGGPNTSLCCRRSASRKAEHQMPKMPAAR
jgi:hypothetical protein